VINSLTFLIGRALWVGLLQALLFGHVFAQSSATDIHTPPSMAPGAPAGSYALSGFDNVNLYNGNLNFRLPLLQVGGRGGASYTMMLAVEHKWRVDHNYEFGVHWPSPNWWGYGKPGYGPGVLQGRQTHEGCGDGGPWPGGQVQTGSLTTLTFTAPDGTEYELRDTLNNGNRLTSTCCCYYQQHANGASRGTVFKTVDGTSATFVSDTTIYDWTGNVESGPHILEPTGYLIFRDGTRYRIEWGKVMWIRDRNGNQLTFTYGGYGVTSVTDSLDRQVTIEYNVNDPQYGLCDRISFAGVGGAPRKIWVAKTNLGNALRSGYSLQTYAQLFPYLSGGSTLHDPSGQVHSVWLPDGNRYQLRYNSHSELARVVLPTGGAFEYDWGDVPGSACTYPEIFRGVLERRVFRDGSTLEGKMVYAIGSVA
jgi:YD repeat-containing protein